MLFWRCSYYYSNSSCERPSAKRTIQSCCHSILCPRWAYVLQYFFSHPLTYLLIRELSRVLHPAILQGTVNDPTTFPTSNKSHGSYHWSFERLLSAALVPLTASAAVVSGSAYPIIDGLLGLSLVVHSHIGFDACITDYLHTRKFPVMGQIAKWGVRALTTGALVGVYAFNTQDIGQHAPPLYPPRAISVDFCANWPFLNATHRSDGTH